MSLDKEDNGASFSWYCSNWSFKMTSRRHSRIVQDKSNTLTNLIDRQGMSEIDATKSTC